MAHLEGETNDWVTRKGISISWKNHTFKYSTCPGVTMENFPESCGLDVRPTRTTSPDFLHFFSIAISTAWLYNYHSPASHTTMSPS